MGVLWRSNMRQRVRVIFGMIVCIAVLIPFAPEGVWDRLGGMKHLVGTRISQQQLQEADPEHSAEQRLEIWKIASTIIAEHPLFGVGIGAYSEEHLKVARRSNFKLIGRGARDTHSTYLNALAENGIPGFVMIVGLFYGVIAFAERVRRRAVKVFPADASRLLALEMGFGSFLVSGIWGSYQKLNVTYVMLVILWSAAAVLKDQLDQASAAPARARVRPATN
jgi:O-antigen ligase